MGLVRRRFNEEMRLHTVLCFVLPGLLFAAELEKIIESEKDEGQQAIYHGEEEGAEQQASETVGPEMASVEQPFNLQDHATLMALQNMSLWGKLKKLNEDDLLAPYISIVEDYAQLLQIADYVYLETETVQEDLAAAEEEHEAIEAKMMEHRLAFSMILKDGHDEPTEKIQFFPRKLLATPEDKLELDKERYEMMENDATDRAFCEDKITMLGLKQLVYGGCEPITEIGIKMVASDLEAAINGGSAGILFPKVLPFITTFSELSEGYRIKSEADLQDSGNMIVFDPLAGSVAGCLQLDQKPLLVEWFIGGGPNMVYMRRRNGFGVLRCTFPSLGALNQVGSKYFLKHHVKAALRDMIFNQLLAALALQHHVVCVDLRPFAQLNLDPHSFEGLYDHIRRVFSDIQPGEGFQIKKLHLCNQP